MANRRRICSLLALCFALAGCELVADFDRDQIPLPDAGPSATPDAGTPDAMLPIPGVDAAAPGVDAAAPDEDGGAGDVDIDAGAGSSADPDAGPSPEAGP